MPRNPDRETVFRFKKFSVSNTLSAMKIGTDGLLLGALAPVRNNQAKVLDIGTGTGVVALMVAQRLPEAQIDAIEINSEATAEARHNFSNSPFFDRLNLFETDFLKWNNSSTEYDLIVSNPPYYINSLKSPESARNAARNQESLPMDRLFERASGMLSHDGEITVILPSELAAEAEYLSMLAGLRLRNTIDVITREGRIPRRCILTFARNSAPVTKTAFTIRDSSGQYTLQYKNALNDFLIKL